MTWIVRRSWHATSWSEHTPPFDMQWESVISITISGGSLGSICTHRPRIADLTDSSMEMGVGRLFKSGIYPPAAVLLGLRLASSCSAADDWDLYVASIGALEDQKSFHAWRRATSSPTKVTHALNLFGAVRTVQSLGFSVSVRCNDIKNYFEHAVTRKADNTTLHSFFHSLTREGCSSYPLYFLWLVSRCRDRFTLSPTVCDSIVSSQTKTPYFIDFPVIQWGHEGSLTTFHSINGTIVYSPCGPTSHPS